MTGNLLSLIQSTSSIQNAFQFLQDKNILRSIAPDCSNCNHQMTCVKDTTRLEGMVWRCPKHKGNKISLRQGSWLQDSRLTFQQFVLMAYLWAIDTRNFQVEQILGVADKTVTQY